MQSFFLLDVVMPIGTVAKILQTYSVSVKYNRRLIFVLIYSNCWFALFPEYDLSMEYSLLCFYCNDTETLLNNAKIKSIPFEIIDMRTRGFI